MGSNQPRPFDLKPIRIFHTRKYFRDRLTTYLEHREPVEYQAIRSDQCRGIGKSC